MSALTEDGDNWQQFVSEDNVYGKPKEGTKARLTMMSYCISKN
jgi:hypothetical protein